MHKLLAIVCVLDILMAVLDCALYLDIGQLIDIKRFLVWKGKMSKFCLIAIQTWWVGFDK